MWPSELSGVHRPEGLRLGLAWPLGPASHAPGRHPEPPVGRLTSTMAREAAMVRCLPPCLPSCVPLQPHGPSAHRCRSAGWAGPWRSVYRPPREPCWGRTHDKLRGPRAGLGTTGGGGTAPCCPPNAVHVSPKHGNTRVALGGQQRPQIRASPCGGGSRPLTCLLVWGRASQGEILQLRDAEPLAQRHTAARQAASFPGQLAEAEAGGQPVPHCPAGHPAWREGRPSSPTRGLWRQS